MAEVDIDLVGKRRLPPWMLGPTVATDRPNKSEQKDENNPSSQVLLVGQKFNKEKGYCLEADSSLMLTRGRNEGTKKSLRNRDKDVENGGGISSTEGGLQKKNKRSKKKGVERLGEAVKESAPRKKRKLKSSELDNGDVKKASSPSEEDGELTIEDLMNIAEEYVKKADDRKEHQHQREAATAGPELDRQLSTTSVFFGNESGASTEGAQRSEVPGTTATSTSLANFTRSRQKDRETTLKGSQEKSAGEVDGSTFNQRRTGDPTQDMLDLFLGPLLKKPQVKEQNLQVMEQDITMDSELSKNGALKETVVPLVTKKKSSLKDKVAMFLG